MKCNKGISWFHNIPLISWFVLRGRCEHCKTPISFRYVFVEFLMAVLFLLCFFKLGVGQELFEILLLVFGLVTVSFIDLDHFILPDEFTIGGIVIGFLLSFANPDRSSLDSFLGIFFGGGILWSIAYLYFLFRKEEGMGGGDIKLLAWIGAFLGWKSLPFVVLSSSIVGTLVGLVFAFKSKAGLKTVIPFGPFLAMGAILYILTGSDLSLWYIQLFMPWIN